MVTLGILMYHDVPLIKEIDVTLEAVHIAHSIYPGTVEQLVLWENGHSLADMEEAKQLLENINTLRKKTSSMRIRIGIKQDYCRISLKESALLADLIELWKIKRGILINLDFIICYTPAHSSISASKGTAAAFNSAQLQALAERDGIRSIDKNIQVMWLTEWIALNAERKRHNATKHIRDLRDYWIHADAFATEYNYPVWMSQAMGDNGWWKLRRYDLLNNPSGYVEYVSDLPPSPKETASTDIIRVTSNDTSIKNKTTTSDFPFYNEAANTKETYTHRTLGAILIGTIFLLVIALAGVGFLVNCKQNLYRYQILTRQEIHEFRHGISENDYNKTGGENFVNTAAFKQPYNNLLEKRKDQFEILTDQPLGGGEFGRVIKAVMRDECDIATEVALKMTKPNAEATAIRGFLSEIKILTYLGNHPNIVPILGAYTAEMYKGTVYIATELCPLGSLRNCLKHYLGKVNDGDGSSVPLNDMIRWSYEIACGMEYLGEKRVIHADLATRNVLLSAESTAKITDFGLSRRMYEYTNYTKTSQEPLPWRWMAYESLKMMDFSPKSDVWSYGVTLWEIFSLGAQPYPGLTWTIDFVETLEDGCRLKKPKHATSEIFEIMEKCWSLGKDARPSFTELKGCTRDVQIKSIEACYTTLSVLPMESNAVEKPSSVSSSIAT